MASKTERIKPWQLPTPKSFIFHNVNLVDSEQGVIRRGCCVKTSAGFIENITDGPMSQTELTNHTAIVDLEGRFLCPGLIDAHVHLMAVPGFEDLSKAFGNPFAVSAFRQPYVCQQMLARGFTSVRDCGGATYALKEAIEDGVFPGPRLFLSVHALSQTGGHADIRGPHDHTECCGGANGDLGRICDGVEDCIKAAREQIRTGADFIKIMAGGGVTTPMDKLENIQFTAEEVQAITTVANNADLLTTAHAYTPRSILHAINNGCRGIEHGNFIDRPTAELMAEKGAFLTPTLVTYAEMNDWPGYLPPESAKKNGLVLEAGIRSLQIALDAGVTICFGTDLLGPLTSAQTREFSIRSQVLSPVELLRTATINPAHMLRCEGRLGQIKAGYVADMIVLDQNPLDDITILDRPMDHLFAVIKDGRVCYSRWSKLPVDTPKSLPLLA
ncbi:amidohydrolase [Aureobasidium sp. EXF-3400]|nr:amidohydrolase [Aureobasidium sp. EXF-12344]KAI4770749.1 amidohydrolase [Aureobasidium sp. EXF-3400]